MFKRLIIFYYLLLPLIVYSPKTYYTVSYNRIDELLRIKRLCKIPDSIQWLSPKAKKYRKQIDSVLKIKIHNFDSIRVIKRILYSRTYKHDKNHKINK